MNTLKVRVPRGLKFNRKEIILLKDADIDDADIIVCYASITAAIKSGNFKGLAYRDVKNIVKADLVKAEFVKQKNNDLIIFKVGDQEELDQLITQTL